MPPDDDVVDRGGEPRITNQRQAKCMPLLVAMVPFTKGNDIGRYLRSRPIPASAM